MHQRTLNGKVSQVVASLLIATVQLPAFAQAAPPTRSEYLVQPVPAGYKIASQSLQGSVALTEMIPANETGDNWTEKIRVQVFLGAKGAQVTQYRDRMQKQWADTCQGALHGNVTDGNDGGAAYAVWMQRCPKDELTGKAVNAWFKVLAGAENFYLVQKSFRFDPAPEHYGQWLTYFRGVNLCNNRQLDRACPAPDQLR